MMSVFSSPRTLNGHSATDHKLYPYAAENELTLAQSCTVDKFGLEPGHCHYAVCLRKPHMNITIENLVSITVTWE